MKAEISEGSVLRRSLRSIASATRNASRASHRASLPARCTSPRYMPRIITLASAA